RWPPFRIAGQPKPIYGHPARGYDAETSADAGRASGRGKPRGIVTLFRDSIKIRPRRLVAGVHALCWTRSRHFLRIVRVHHRGVERCHAASGISLAPSEPYLSDLLACLPHTARPNRGSAVGGKSTAAVIGKLVALFPPDPRFPNAAHRGRLEPYL